MNGIASNSTTGSVIVGVDTHKHLHVAVALDANGVRLAERAVSADSGGYAQLEAWARALGRVRCFGIEGTGSYGAGLAGFLRRGGHRVVEVNRADRRARRNNGKSDSGDAEAAARAVLSGQASAVPKSADGVVEMIRQVKVARDTARKAKTAAIVTLKAMAINAPAPLRESVDGLGDKALIKRCAAYRPGSIDTPTAAAKHALRALARRWVALDAEVAGHDRELDRLTTQASPGLRDGFGIGADSAAELLIVFGDNPERIHSGASRDSGVLLAAGSTSSDSEVVPAGFFPGQEALGGCTRVGPGSTEPLWAEGVGGRVDGCCGWRVVERSDGDCRRRGRGRDATRGVRAGVGFRGRGRLGVCRCRVRGCG